ncbi:MAG: MerR family transcriptional regulator [Longimicrobiales bacterium]
MSEQHDSEVLFPWEMEKGTAAEAEGEAGRIHPSTPSQGGGKEEAEGDADRFAILDTELARKAAERANAALRDRPIAPKEYYAISEVCELVGLKSHVLRYWETQFQVLNPSKNRSGNRVYQRKEIRLIMLVKHLLYEEKYTVEGAKARLDQLRRGGTIAEATGVVIDHAMVEALRADLTELNTLLTPPQRA